METENKVKNVQKDHTIVESVVKRLESLSKQEKRVTEEIVRVQKRIDSVPELKARIENLKLRKTNIAKKRKNELADIEALTKFLKATNNAQSTSEKA